MNKLEAIIYNLVKTNPRIKNKLRNIYQLAMAVVPVKKVSTNYQITTREGFFFGFHDKTPFSYDDSKLLAHRYRGDDRRTPDTDDQVDIGYFEGADYLQFKPLHRSTAWNWNQGAMLQWIGETDHLIFNDFDGKRHVAKISDCAGSLLETLDLPIGAVSPDGTKALSYDFARLRRGMPGYGYSNGSDPDYGVNIPGREGSGLKLIELKNSEVRELFTLADIAALEPEESMQGAFHYFTHCLFNPSGGRFAFFHRWLVDDNLRFTRLITCDMQGKDIYIFPTAGMVSHYAWKDDQHVLAYASTRADGDRYYLFEDQGSGLEVVGRDCFNSDGHPQFSPEGNYFVTDTYPDRFRRQALIIFDWQAGRRRDLARMQLPLRFIREPRCDFHPRWNRQGDMICFDSAHTGNRSLCTVSLSNSDH